MELAPHAGWRIKAGIDNFSTCGGLIPLLPKPINESHASLHTFSVFRQEILKISFFFSVPESQNPERHIRSREEFNNRNGVNMGSRADGREIVFLTFPLSHTAHRCALSLSLSPSLSLPPARLL